MESVKLLAISLTNPDTDVLKIDMEQWNKDLPFYEAKALQLPKHLLGQIFFYSAERYVRAYECMDETVNPFTALAFSSAQELKRVYPPTNETVNAYSVGIRVLVAMAGCKRLFSNGLSTLELWDIAFSRQLLNKNHIIELLRDDPGYASPVRNDDAEFVKLIGSSEFLEVVSREAYTFILEAASKFKLPIPALFYDRLGSVLEELGVAGNDVERFKDKTRALLEKGTCQIKSISC